MHHTFEPRHEVEIGGRAATGSAAPAFKLISLATILAMVLPTLGTAQNVQRQSYVMSDAMHKELDSRQFNSNRVEKIVVGITDAFSSNDLGPILDESAAEIRITDNKGVNKVVDKKDLAAFKMRLFGAAKLATVADENGFILRSESIGINGGEFWISEDCLDDKCDQKKTHIITINLP